MEYEATIGLETHVQLRTVSKMFCGCATAFGAPPNSQTCPVCLGLPGVLPVINEEAIRKTILTGLMLGCRIATLSKFDRKNYFYPDMPKNYQISQYDRPLCEQGVVELDYGVLDRKRWGEIKKIGITRVHLEEDVGKLFHFENSSGVDFNRAGLPLMEVVSEPDLSSPDEAWAYLTTLRGILAEGGISDCDMEKGQVRCDVNVSMRPKGQQELGKKIEIKNMNTFSGVRRALEYEIKRQLAALGCGEKLVQETRRWDDASDMTESMRTKEQAHDYRYFPEPDLLPVKPDQAWLARLLAGLPETPAARRQRLAEQYQLGTCDAAVLATHSGVSVYFEKAVTSVGGKISGKTIANWVINDLQRELGDVPVEKSPVPPEALVKLVALVEGGKISSTTGRQVLVEMFKSGRPAEEIVATQGLAQVSDTGALEEFCRQAIAANPKIAEDYRGGKLAALNALKGQVMKLSKGKANAQQIDPILRQLLGG